jgi:hypothetical protein
MSRIFDNIEQDLLLLLRSTMEVSKRADFCVRLSQSAGLAGHRRPDPTGWDPEAGQVCRVLVGMQRPPHEEIRELYRQAAKKG